MRLHSTRPKSPRARHAMPALALAAAVALAALPARADHLYHSGAYDGDVTQPVIAEGNPYVVYLNPDLYQYGGVDEISGHLQDHAPMMNAGLADQLSWKWSNDSIGAQCDATCGQRSCGIMGAKAKYSVPFFVSTMAASPTALGDVLNCPAYPSQQALAAYSAAWSYAWALQEGDPETPSESMAMAMTADAFALMALAQEYGYDAQLAQTVLYTRTLTPFYRGSEYASAPVIAAASQAASAYPRTTMRYRWVTGSDDDDYEERTRPTEYTDLIGYLQPPDYYEFRTVKSIFSDAKWRRQRADSDAALLQKARAMAQPFVWSDAEIADAEATLETSDLRLIADEGSTLPSDWIQRLQRVTPLPPRLEAMGNDLAAVFAACAPK